MINYEITIMQFYLTNTSVFRKLDLSLEAKAGRKKKILEKYIKGELKIILQRLLACLH